MPRVHYAITRKVKEGREAEFEERLRRFACDSLGDTGVVGVHLIGPLSESSPNEYGILRSFEDAESAESFYESHKFMSWSEGVQPLVEGQAKRRQLSGLEAFFREPGPPPKRWKMAVVTWLGVFPSVLVWSALLGPALGWMPWLAAAAVINAAVVATLTWLVMPWLIRLLHSWLHTD